MKASKLWLREAKFHGPRSSILRRNRRNDIGGRILRTGSPYDTQVQILKHQNYFTALASVFLLLFAIIVDLPQGGRPICNAKQLHGQPEGADGELVLARANLSGTVGRPEMFAEVGDAVWTNKDRWPPHTTEASQFAKFGPHEQFGPTIEGEYQYSMGESQLCLQPEEEEKSIALSQPLHCSVWTSRQVGRPSWRAWWMFGGLRDSLV